MRIIESPREMQALCAQWKCNGHSVGFVPTMGALHDGHLSLCRRAQDENARFVASIFVNPMQFGPREDLARYPRPFEHDAQLLREHGCHVLFAPSTEAMYGAGDMTHGAHTVVEVTQLGALWEGVLRPGHLRGVATVVTKLFNITMPTRAYFGEKDYQQLKVVEHLAADLHLPLQIVAVETTREADGLAMSSRNAYLSPDERRAATTLYRAMQAGVARAMAGQTDVAMLGEAMEAVCAGEPMMDLQYVAVVDAATLGALTRLDDRPARILIAARVGKTRLIDNLAISSRAL